MKVYLDVNVILDFLLAREDFGMEVAEIISLSKNEGFEIITSPNSLVIAFAKLKKEIPDPQHVKHSLALFRKLVTCVSLEGSDLDRAIAREIPRDLEDGVQLELALKCKADILLTNDKKGFRTQEIKVMNTANFLRNWEH